MIFRRRRSVPLSPPQVAILLPDVRTKRELEEIAEIKESAETIMRGEASEHLIPWSHQVLSTFVPALSAADESHAKELEKNAEGHYGIFAIAVALGASIAGLEQQRGRQRPNKIDAAFWSAIGWGPRDASYLFGYFVQLGYWLARTETQGVEPALAAIGARLSPI